MPSVAVRVEDVGVCSGGHSDPLRDLCVSVVKELKKRRTSHKIHQTAAFRPGRWAETEDAGKKGANGPCVSRRADPLQAVAEGGERASGRKGERGFGVQGDFLRSLSLLQPATFQRSTPKNEPYATVPFSCS